MSRQARSIRGSVLSIEVAISAILGIIFMALAVNMFIVVQGFSELDAAARDAARAAAATNNPYTGFLAAQQAALSHRTDGRSVTQPKLSGPTPPQNYPQGTNYTTNPDFQYIVNPNNTNPASGSPYCAVTTRCVVNSPITIPINFFGAQMSAGSGSFNYARTYIYPILGTPFSPNQNVPSANSAPPTAASTPSSGTTSNGTPGATNSTPGSTSNSTTAASTPAATTATQAAATTAAAATAAAASAASTTYNSPSATAARAAATTAAAASQASTASTYNSPAATTSRAAAAQTAETAAATAAAAAAQSGG